MTEIDRVRRETADGIAAKIREFRSKIPPDSIAHLSQIASLRWAEYAARAAAEGGDLD